MRTIFICALCSIKYGSFLTKQDPEDAVDIGGMDLSDENSKKGFEKLNSQKYEELLKTHPYLKTRDIQCYKNFFLRNLHFL